MSIYFYEPFYNIDRVFDRLFETAFPQNGESSNAAGRPIHPKMDLQEDALKNTVTANFELPGLRKEDVNVDVHDGRLTISGEIKSSSEHQEEGYAVRERKSGKFSRMLRVPRGVKEDIKASMNDGVLTVTFPKTIPEAQPKKITIS
ncbi:HSP20-like chaperone [Lentinula edodes]|uniref:HSP20-like chaperone n=1 Tax=Lentinula lateritia TaxID=40482 RepID=A0A9W9DFA5_9AGAR|nr:HSP20-like chaperone [Lentinula edodes]